MKWTTGTHRLPDPLIRRPSVPSQHGLLRWLYGGRVAVASGLFLAALLRLNLAQPGDLAIASVALALTVSVSAVSAWYSEVLRRPVSADFLYLQALFDLALVTTVVHLTGGPLSDFFSLYILVIAMAAIMMPVGRTLLIAALAGLLYFADIFWGHPTGMTSSVWLQLGIFGVVAGATRYLGSRVLVVGAEKDELQRELSRVQLEASDILGNIRSGVLSIDNAGHLLYMNPAAERILGLSRERWDGKDVIAELARISPEFLAALRTTGNQGTRLVGAEVTVYANGRAFPVGITTTSLHTDGDEGSAAVTAIFSDISDRKRIEELRLRTERLEAVAALSASLAHEIKNPLASIRSSVEQLSGSKRASKDEQLLGNLIVRESDRLSRLLSEFLDFSRVHVTRSALVDLRKVAEGAIGMVHAHPDCSSKAQLTVSGEASIHGDEDLLHRIVTNLVLNAVQAGGNGTHVDVAISELPETSLPKGVNVERPVEIRISDNGPGIPDDIQVRIFEPFVTGRAGGSGLGLSIVQRAVEAHLGVVLVDTAKGRGTTFTILLPSAANAQRIAQETQ